MKFLLSVFLTCLIAYAILAFFMWKTQDRLVYRPSLCGTDFCQSPKDLNLPYEDIHFQARDGVALHGWFIPVPPSRRSGTVIFFHGNAGHIGHRLETISMLNRFGLDVFIFDYRGFGNSEGHPSEEGTYQDAQAAWDYVTEVLKIPAKEILLHGRSLGGGVVSELASRVKAAGVILESTFTSIPNVGAEIYPWLPVRWLARIHYDTKSRIADIQSPMLIVHSPQDRLIPFHHGQELYDLVSKRAQFLEIMGGHGRGFLDSGDIYTEGLYRFLEQIDLVN